MEGKHLKMELDTGSVYSVLPYKDYEELFSHIKIRDTSVMMKTYTGQKLSPVGVINVQVKYKSQLQNLDLYGVPGGKQIAYSSVVNGFEKYSLTGQKYTVFMILLMFQSRTVQIQN